MTCKTFIEFLLDYLAEELPASQRDEFEAHLAECVACVAYLKTYQQTVTLGKAAFTNLDVPVPSDVPEDLIKGILAARRA